MAPKTKNIPAFWKNVGLTKNIPTRFRKYSIGMISNTVFKSENEPVFY